MSSTETRALIQQAVERLQREVPSLAKLKLVARLELRARGGDAPIWRVAVPGPDISKDAAGDARLDISVSRSHFNELAKDGRLDQWVEAYELGHVRVTGEPAVTKLLGALFERQRARAGH